MGGVLRWPQRLQQTAENPRAVAAGGISVEGTLQQASEAGGSEGPEIPPAPLSGRGRHEELQGRPRRASFASQAVLQCHLLIESHSISWGWMAGNIF